MATYVTKCKRCGSTVTYRPNKLIMESVKEEKSVTVRCPCNGDSDGKQHTEDYRFPDEFKKLPE